MGKLNVYYKAQNGSIFRIFSRIGNLGDAWRRESIQIPPTRGLQVRLSLCKFIPTHPRPEPIISSFYKSTHDLICWFYFCLFPSINHLHGISYCQTVKTLFLFVTFKHSCINVYSVKKTLCLSVGVLSHYTGQLDIAVHVTYGPHIILLRNVTFIYT